MRPMITVSLSHHLILSRQHGLRQITPNPPKSLLPSFRHALLPSPDCLILVSPFFIAQLWSLAAPLLLFSSLLLLSHTSVSVSVSSVFWLSREKKIKSLDNKSQSTAPPFKKNSFHSPGQWKIPSLSWCWRVFWDVGLGPHLRVYLMDQWLQSMHTLMRMLHQWLAAGGFLVWMQETCLQWFIYLFLNGCTALNIWVFACSSSFPLRILWKRAEQLQKLPIRALKLSKRLFVGGMEIKYDERRNSWSLRHVFHSSKLREK